MKFASALFGDLVNNDKLILFIRNRNFEFAELLNSYFRNERIGD